MAQVQQATVHGQVVAPGASSQQQGIPQPSAPPPPVQVVMVGAPVEYIWRPPAEPPAAAAYYGKWSSGTCGWCFDPLYACGFLWCFPCAAILRVQSIVEKVGGMNIPIIGLVDRSNALMYGILAGLIGLATCWFSFGLPFVIFVFLIYKGVQARFNIKEDDLGICCKVYCCACCSLIKLGRHVDGYYDALQAPPTVPV